MATKLGSDVGFRSGIYNGYKVIGTQTLGLRGLVLWLKFNEGSGSIAKDSSFYNNHGTIYGATWTDGKFGKALSLDGVDDYGKVPHTESLKFTNKDELTVMAWIYLKGLTGNHQMIVCKGLVPGYWLYWKFDENYWRFLIADGTNYLYAQYYDLNPLNKWLQLVGVYSNNTVMLYVNGEKKDENTKTLTDFTLTENLLIGKNPYDTYYFNGTIDEVRIYNRALSEEEIKMLYYNRIGAVPSKTI